jgi:hypothetical protein
MRKQITDMTNDLKRLSKKAIGQKEERRERTRQIKQMALELSARQAHELTHIDADQDMADRH